MFILVERPGELMTQMLARANPRFKELYAEKGDPMEWMLVADWDKVERLTAFFANRKEPKFTFVTVEDLVCTNLALPCKDNTFGLPHNRYDGLHYFDSIGN